MQGSPNPKRVSVQMLSADPRISVISIEGEIDMTTEHLVIGEIMDRLAVRPKTFVLDLTGVTFFGSAGLHVLLDGQAAAERLGTRLAVVVPEHGVVNRVLTLTGVDRLLDLRRDLGSALRGS
ncbi:hypothetical protein Lesp02_00700 [Lentzea sp. NBRC 105346]|uniref:STAS domain-containing protein n=1 Tax=Lentzea sp. NBRC 105346 TaxID=3032205 RepID=UPI0024A32D32|nr:STAS domain-containing protein [Lentzea sp. NBRC 105346]GLZ27880.1 hypothetical protein Lesp02_00700 [Lentzea sp. NBRC 105346]